MAQLVYLLVDIRFLLDVRVRGREIGLGLVVVVVADEVLDGVVREVLLELGAELGCQGLVVAHHQSRPLHLFDDVSHREGLAAAGDTEKGLLLVAFLEALHQPGDGLGLVTGWFEVGFDSEKTHGQPSPAGQAAVRRASRACCHLTY